MKLNDRWVGLYGGSNSFIFHWFAFTKCLLPKKHLPRKAETGMKASSGIEYLSL